jgi:hypothetical protein
MEVRNPTFEHEMAAAPGTGHLSRVQTMRPSAFSVASQGVLAKYGADTLDPRASLGPGEIRAMTHAHARLEKKYQRSVKALVVMALGYIVGLMAIFGLSIAAAFLMKDTTVSKQGTLLLRHDSDSEPTAVATASAKSVESLEEGFDFLELLTAERLSLADEGGNLHSWVISGWHLRDEGTRLSMTLAGGQTAEADAQSVVVFDAAGEPVAGAAFVDLDAALQSMQFPKAGDASRQLLGRSGWVSNLKKFFKRETGQLVRVGADSIQKGLEDRSSMRRILSQTRTDLVEHLGDRKDALGERIDREYCRKASKVARAVVSPERVDKLKKLLLAASGKGGDELSSINPHWFYGTKTTTETSYKRVTQNFDLEDTGDDSENCWSEYCTGYGTAFGGAKAQVSLGGALMGPTEMGDTCELHITVGLPGDVLGASLGISFSPEGDFRGLRASLNVGLGASPGTSVHYASCTVGNGVFSSLLERSLYSGARASFKSCAGLVVEKLKILSPLCGNGLGEKCLQAVDAAAKMLHVASDGKVLAESNEAEVLRTIIMPDSVPSDTLSSFELPKEGQPSGCILKIVRGEMDVEECSQQCSDDSSCAAFSFSPTYSNFCEMYDSTSCTVDTCARDRLYYVKKS